VWLVVDAMTELLRLLAVVFSLEQGVPRSGNTIGASFRECCSRQPVF
jgi:hypothetical protein